MRGLDLYIAKSVGDPFKVAAGVEALIGYYRWKPGTQEPVTRLMRTLSSLMPLCDLHLDLAWQEHLRSLPLLRRRKGGTRGGRVEAGDAGEAHRRGVVRGGCDPRGGEAMIRPGLLQYL